MVAGLLLLCALPLGGCVALIAFGISEIDERSDAIESVTDDFMESVVAGRATEATAQMDGGSGCLEPSEFVSSIETELPAADDWRVDDVAFVDRNDNGYLANVSEPENFVYEGREDDGFAIVTGALVADGVDQTDLRILLLKPGGTWRVCTLELQ